MDSENKRLLVVLGVFLIILVGGYAGIKAYTGFDTPFSVVMSQSMQHDNERSEIGCIDTGDIVIVKSPEKADIQSYFEGLDTGFRSFDDYGSVIIYERGYNQNPVIHRAILWLEYNGDGTWSAPDLEGHENKWLCMDVRNGSLERITNHNELSGTLKFIDITQSGKTLEINLDNLGDESGFLTLGDNPVGNLNFDQNSGIVNHLVGMNDIRSVPILEIPWAGTTKILLKNDGENLEYVPNSLPSLILAFIVIISLILIVDAIFLRKNTEDMKNEMKKN
ncbi:MAG: S26 family signal peptidase [Candidatus Methanomethylophilaceae archaeon]|nr:S26 family signal peptidase [Candidatus Methanomethylophilaceae archaeon]